MLRDKLDILTKEYVILQADEGETGEYYGDLLDINFNKRKEVVYDILVEEDGKDMTDILYNYLKYLKKIKSPVTNVYSIIRVQFEEDEEQKIKMYLLVDKYFKLLNS